MDGGVKGYAIDGDLDNVPVVQRRVFTEVCSHIPGSSNGLSKAQPVRVGQESERAVSKPDSGTTGDDAFVCGSHTGIVARRPTLVKSHISH